MRRTKVAFGADGVNIDDNGKKKFNTWFERLKPDVEYCQ
jgi:hypothetical protein